MNFMSYQTLADPDIWEENMCENFKVILQWLVYTKFYRLDSVVLRQIAGIPYIIPNLKISNAQNPEKLKIPNTQNPD